MPKKIISLVLNKVVHSKNLVTLSITRKKILRSYVNMKVMREIFYYIFQRSHIFSKYYLLIQLISI